jgi:Secretion system C-terminal sorting domain
MKNSKLHLVSKLIISLFLLLGLSGKSFSQNCLLADAGPDKQICPSGGSVMIGTPSVAGATYFWSPSTGLNNTSIAQPIASPTTTTIYTLTVTSGQNLLPNGDFENGYTGFGTDYAIFPNSDGSCLPSQTSYGSISVNTNPWTLNGQWCKMTDHSPLGFNMLTVDGSAFPNRRVWFATVPVTSNTTYSFSGWVTNNTYTDPSETPMLRFQINGVVVLQNYLVPWSLCQWGQFSMNWSSGASATALIEMFDDNLSCFRNDFNLDDLSLTNCPASTDQVTVCVCQAPPPPEIVTVQIPLNIPLIWQKFNTAVGVGCWFNRPHDHEQYRNICSRYWGLLSGYLPADNNLPSYHSFEANFSMYPRWSGTYAYLGFWQNTPGTYEPCTANDIISANMYMFHSTYNFPFCYPGHNYLIQPHSGSNAFTIKRTTDDKNHWYTCTIMPINNSIYNYDNPPPVGPEVINVPASTTPTQDYIIDVTQMVKNSLQITSDSHLGFLFQQENYSSYNNVFFNGNNNDDDIIDPGEPYVELTYIRRRLPINCFLSTPVGNANQILNKNNNFLKLYDTLTSNKPLLSDTRIIPNPANNEITISSPDKVEFMEIFRIDGILLKQINVSDKKIMTISVSNLKPGYYFIKLRTNKGLKYLKFAVQR